MMQKFFIAPPLIAKSAQLGLSVSTAASGEPAEGNPKLTEPQKYLKTGEVLPVIFCRRRTIGSVVTGGVMALPKATEGYFSNDISEFTNSLKPFLFSLSSKLIALSKFPSPCIKSK